jgi:hypothetical protein
MKVHNDEKAYATARGDQLTRYSAERVLSIVFEFCSPGSVVDIGCGVGTWLSVCRSKGVSDVLGMDGSHVDTDLLQIPKESFSLADLAKPISIGRSFDLAISLDVAERLPASIADAFVHELTTLAPIVLFSAAIPHQGGFMNINEQWPTYWATRFAVERYVVADAIRPRIWGDSNVLCRYRQNTIIFVREEFLTASPLWRWACEHTRNNQLDLIHPDLWAAARHNGVPDDPFAPCLRRLWRSLLLRLRGRRTK